MELQSLHLQEAGSLAVDDHIHGALGAGSHMPHLKRNSARVSVKWSWRRNTQIQSHFVPVEIVV